MKVFKCNVCGVEFYEGHTTCPFCKEPADKATYVGTKEERADSTDLFQYAPCDEDVSKCTTNHSQSSHANVSSTYSNGSSSYNSAPYSTGTKRTGTGIHLILGILSLFWFIVPAIINIIIFKSHDKSGWSDSELRTAKIGVTLSKIALGLHIAVIIMYVLIAFLFIFLKF